MPSVNSSNVSFRTEPAQRKFVDLDLSFEMNPITHDISRKVNSMAIRQSLKNIVLTRFYEVGFHPLFGSQVSELLFTPFNAITKMNLERIVRLAIENYEPRVRVLDVEVEEDPRNERLTISISYIIINENQPQTFSFAVFRAR